MINNINLNRLNNVNYKLIQNYEMGVVVFNLIDKRVVDKIYKNYEITSINY